MCGWMGLILGDEGGGFNVGQEAVQQLLIEPDRASVGGPAPSHSTLKENILEWFGIGAPLDILTAVYLSDPTSSTVQPPNTQGHLLMLRENLEKTIAALPTHLRS